MLSRLRRFLTRSTRSYDAAAGGRRWRGFIDMPSQVAAMHAARGPAARRARGLVGNNPLAASAAEAWVSALVGAGIKAQSAHPEADTRATLSAAFEAWTDEADADGLADFYGLQALVARRLVVDGEAFVLLVTDGDRLRLRVIDGEQVDPTLHRDLPGGARIVSGIEFDASGRRMAYHVRRDNPGLPFAVLQEPVRVPASEVLHVFRQETPGQVRGLSWFAPVLLRLADLDAHQDAQLVRQKLGAMLAGFVVTADGTTGFGGDADQDGATVAGMEPGAMITLPPGKDIRFSEPPGIGEEANAFLRITQREIAAGLGLPYETLTGDLSSVNYSSIRAGLVEFRRRVEAIQHHLLAFQFLRPVWARWATLEVLAGRAAGAVEPALACRWITPKQAWVDPAKDVTAELDAIAGGLMSRREAVASRGYDVEALDDEIAADHDREKRLGLTFNLKAQNDNQLESPPVAA